MLRFESPHPCEEVRGDIHWGSHGRGFFTQLQVHPRWQCDEVIKKKQKVGTKKQKCKNRAYVNVDHVLSTRYISWQEIYDKNKYISNEIGISEYNSIFLWYPYFTDISMKHPVCFIRLDIPTWRFILLFTRSPHAEALFRAMQDNIQTSEPEVRQCVPNGGTGPGGMFLFSLW